MRTRIVFGALAALLLAPPAHAAELDPVCREIVETTPVLIADLDGDGDSDVPSGQASDVTICTDVGATSRFPVSVERCDWGTHPVPSCMKVLVHIDPVDVSAGASAQLCYTTGRFTTCTTLTTPPTPGLPHETICFGWDLNGYSPCWGGSSDDR